MLLKKPVLLSLLLNLLFLFVCLGIGGFHYGSLDDYFMSAIVTGAYGGEFDAHTLFVNGAYAYFLRPFYAIRPGIGWYFIFELLAVFASFTSITYCLLKKQANTFGIVIGVFVLACLTPAFYLQLGFTQCAAILTAAGILQIYTGNVEKKWQYFVLGVFSLISGIVFRREAFLLGVPFLFAVLVFSWLEIKVVRKRIVAALLLCFCAYWGLQEFNQTLYRNGEYSYYLAYQGPRAMLGDGAYYDSGNVFDELEERGASGRDFDLLQRWVFYDKEVFCLDSLAPIVNAIQRNRYDLNYAKLPVALFLVVAKSFFCVNAWCWGVLCLLLFMMFPKRASWYAWGSLLLMSLCLSYLLLQNRVVGYVENSIWLYAIASAIPFFEKNALLNQRKIERLLGLIGCLSIGCFCFAFMTLPKIENDRMLFGSPKKSMELRQLVQHVHEHPDDVFLFPFNSYKEYALFDDATYKSIAPNSLSNIIPLGYWNINLSGMEKEMAKRGVKNPIRDIVKENVFVLDEGNKLRLEEFYQRHYGFEVAIDTVQSFGNKKLLKYSIKADNP